MSLRARLACVASRSRRAREAHFHIIFVILSTGHTCGRDRQTVRGGGRGVGPAGVVLVVEHAWPGFAPCARATCVLAVAGFDRVRPDAGATPRARPTTHAPRKKQARRAPLVRPLRARARTRHEMSQPAAHEAWLSVRTAVGMWATTRAQVLVAGLMSEAPARAPVAVARQVVLDLTLALVRNRPCAHVGQLEVVRLDRPLTVQRDDPFSRRAAERGRAGGRGKVAPRRRVATCAGPVKADGADTRRRRERWVAWQRSWPWRRCVWHEAGREMQLLGNIVRPFVPAVREVRIGVCAEGWAESAAARVAIFHSCEALTKMILLCAFVCSDEALGYARIFRAGESPTFLVPDSRPWQPTVQTRWHGRKRPLPSQPRSGPN